MDMLAVLALAVTLAVPGRSNSNVSLAADGAFVVATWAATVSGGPTDIYAAVSRDSGATFSAPVRVNTKEGDARANGEQPPRVALVTRRAQPPAIVIVWMAKREARTVLLSARSDDAGRSFSASGVVPGSDAAGNRGWEAIAADGRGGVHVLWLDHRELAPPPGTAPPSGAAAPAGGNHQSHQAHQHRAGDSVAMAQRSKLYVATIGEPETARAITGGVCYCCKTALVAGPGASVFAAWRHVYPGSERDIAFTVSRDNGRTFAEPIRVSPDRWMLNGCPDDGPAMAADARGGVHLAWPTLVTDAAGEPGIGLFYASSGDGRSFSPRVRLPTEGQAHHPQIALMPDGRVLVAWDETAEGVRRIVLARASAAGKDSDTMSFTREVLSTAGAAAYPVLAIGDRGALAAWTSGTGAASVIHLEQADRVK
jgi:hypothetical protein